MLNIVLHEPEIPSNTGNIGRTCVAAGIRLHLIEPMGFQINDKMLKRAGLDYWEHLDVTVYDCLEDFFEQNPDAVGKMFMATTKATAIPDTFVPIALSTKYAVYAPIIIMSPCAKLISFTIP